ncbi:MAG: sigma-54-dependent Fis family transcriptional regulator [Candidatus Aminicenantes bacterium]|nr:sigma-54-dependent Fis family transcriptional regulator [Candidatus Aminicenantes bacterium]
MELLDTKIIGNSLAVRKKLEFIRKVANSNKNVLILGETGTGKDLAARKLHEESNRRDKPFVAINCANIPVELFEAELFGYARGAFTGAVKEKPGLLEVAQNGTIFLDEIGDLSLYLQAKILRMIEEKKVRRVGETIMRKIYARFIFATNKFLEEEVIKGKFRKDLYYRISVVKFYIPPLKERKEDIPLLVRHILEREVSQSQQKKEISPYAIKKLMKYDFPGNIRELENVIERACILTDGEIIRENDIDLDFEQEATRKTSRISPEFLRETLEKCRWNKTKAAMEIGKSRRQFYRLLEKYQMDDCIK